MNAVPITAELGKHMLARRLLAEHAARCGYPAHVNEAISVLFFAWLAVALDSRPASFHDFVIQTLGERHG